MSGGAVIAGGTVSTTSTRCCAVARLPAASVAVHVTRMLPIGMTAGASLSRVTAPAASAAAGAANRLPGAAVSWPAAEPASSTRPGAADMEGGTVSRTVTDCCAVAALPDPSRAVHVTAVVPIGNTAGASLATDATPTASDASASPVSTEAPWGDSASASISAGAARDGGVVSSTVISCSAVAVLPASSVAVHVRMLVPSGSAGGASLSSVTAPAASAAVGSSNRLGAPSG